MIDFRFLWCKKDFSLLLFADDSLRRRREGKISRFIPFTPNVCSNVLFLFRGDTAQDRKNMKTESRL